MRVTSIDPKDIKDDCFYLTTDIKSTNIPDQVSAIVEQVFTLSPDVIPAITDYSFCFAEKKQNFFEELDRQLKEKYIPFKKIYLFKRFIDDVQKPYFLIEL